MAPSTNTPIEMATPASDVRLEVMPRWYMGMNDSATVMGMVMMGTNADGPWNRNNMITILTMIISAISSCFKLVIDSLMRCERSYVETISTPSGREGLS